MIELSISTAAVWYDGTCTRWLATAPEISGAYYGASPEEALCRLILATNQHLRDAVVRVVERSQGDWDFSTFTCWVGLGRVPQHVRDAARGIL